MRCRRKVGLTDREVARLREEALAAGMTESAYIRRALLAAWREGELPRRKRSNPRLELVHALAEVSYQFRKVGANINQLAKQANQGMVPLTRQEVTYLTNRMQELYSLAASVLERDL